MCYLCLQDFDFELPVKPNLEQKKKRIRKIKSLLNFATQIAIIEPLYCCKSKVEELEEEQYRLSREF